MHIIQTETVRTYYVADGQVNYKVVHQTWSPEPEWRVKHHPGTDGSWSVYSAQGIHAYARLCDPDKATHKRVVNAVKALIWSAKYGPKDGESHGLEILEV